MNLKPYSNEASRCGRDNSGQSLLINVLSADHSKSPWLGNIDVSELKRYFEFLGIKKPVHIEMACLQNYAPFDRDGVEPGDGFRQTLGATWHNYVNGAHFVTITMGIDVDQANHAFLHELVHCMQLERDGEKKANKTYRLELKRNGYDANALEVEAEKYANENADKFRIAIAGGTLDDNAEATVVFDNRH